MRETLLQRMLSFMKQTSQTNRLEHEGPHDMRNCTITLLIERVNIFVSYPTTQNHILYMIEHEFSIYNAMIDMQIYFDYNYSIYV